MSKKTNPAQNFVPIKEIRDGVVILDDGSMRMVIMASSINFGLKSPDEQAGVLIQFQSFLNSLEFSTQIFIQSRRLDIRPYLSLLQERLKKQQGELMRIQTQEYIDFIRKFVQETNIMTKTFFIIIPYTQKSLSSSGGFGGFFSKKDNSAEEKKGRDMEAFEEARSQLKQRVNIIKSGLARTGVRTATLNTEEATELYYRFFNPSQSERPSTTK